VKIKLDENLDVRLAEPLQNAGHDATTVRSQGFSGVSDEALFTLCKEEDRIFVTLDLDFANCWLSAQMGASVNRCV